MGHIDHQIPGPRRLERQAVNREIFWTSEMNGAGFDGSLLSLSDTVRFWIPLTCKCSGTG
jgi:hypothetical protein